MKRRLAAAVAATWILTALLAGCSRRHDREATGNLAPRTVLPASEDLLALGSTTYGQNCAPCHGDKGDGLGPAAYLLYPKPRNFMLAKYRLVSTWDYAPTDEDLFRTISRGMPGSAMPSWAHLTEETRWGLVHYIKSLAENPIQINADRQPQRPGDTPQGHIQIPAETPDTPEGRERGRQLFVVGCSGCHGAQGKGDGQQNQEDSEGFPLRPRDLTAGIYKGSPDPQEVYKRIVAGLPGSPMPASLHLYGNPAWDVVHFVRALSSQDQRARMEMQQFRIAAVRVERIPDHPDDSVWRSAPAVNLHLMPLWWRDNRPEEVAVQALHDGREVAIQMIWPDPTHDHTAMRPQDFRDAAAIEFSLQPNPPFFAMGEAAQAVNIWMWKAERQADLEPAFQELEKVYPNIGIDSYPNLLRSPLEQPMRNALTLESDPAFVTGWGAGNIVSDPTRRSAAEDLQASGFGTLKARPMADQKVTATGTWNTGSYRVVFRRGLSGSGRQAVSIRPGTVVPVSFAVWDGSAGDRDGKKSVTIWQQMEVAP